MPSFLVSCRRETAMSGNLAVFAWLLSLFLSWGSKAWKASDPEVRTSTPFGIFAEVSSFKETLNITIRILALGFFLRIDLAAILRLVVLPLPANARTLTRLTPSAIASIMAACSGVAFTSSAGEVPGTAMLRTGGGSISLSSSSTISGPVNPSNSL